MRAHLWRDLIPMALVFTTLALVPFGFLAQIGWPEDKTGIALAINWALLLLSLCAVIAITQPMNIELANDRLECRYVCSRRTIMLDSVRLHGYYTRSNSKGSLYFLYSPGFLLYIPLISAGRKRIAQALDGVLPPDIPQVDVVPPMSSSFRMSWQLYRALTVVFVPLMFVPTLAVVGVIVLTAIGFQLSAIASNIDLLVAYSWLVTIGLSASLFCSIKAQSMEWGLGGSCEDLQWLLKQIAPCDYGCRNRVRVYMLSSALQLPCIKFTEAQRQRLHELLSSNNPMVVGPLLGVCGRFAKSDTIAIVEKYTTSDNITLRKASQRILPELRARFGP